MREKPFTPFAWFFPCLPLGLAFVIYQADWQASSFLFINRLTPLLPDRLWAGLTFLGNGWGAFAVAIPLLLLAPRILSAGIFGALISGLVSQVLKPFFDLPRPAGLLIDGSFYRIGEPLYNHALPSGHTLTAFAIAAAMYFVCNKQRRHSLAILFALALFIGLSRIAVGAHWLTDVLAGMGIGLWCGMLGAKLALAIPEAKLHAQSLWSRLIACGGLIAAYILLTQTIDIALNIPLQYACVALIAITLFFFIQAQGAKPVDHV
jgi:membrane-associated phospholipid phosphatase